MEEFQNQTNQGLLVSQTDDAAQVAFYKQTYAHVAGGV